MSMTGRPAAAAAALALAALGAAATPAPAAASGTRPIVECGFVAFTPNSGDGVFQVRARWILCRTARAKLRAARGDPRRLRGWDCRLLRRSRVTGAGRHRCTNRALVHGVMRERMIAFTTGN